MTTGATGQLGLALPVQGELSGTWGNTVNNGITEYTNIAIAGTLSFAGDGAITLANTTGDASATNIGSTTAQYMAIRVTGTLTTAKIITAPSYSKTYVVDNAATGSTVTFKASGQTGVSIAVGEKALVFFNGTDYVKVSSTVNSGVTSFTAGTTGLTPSTATTGAVTLAGTLAVANGGTGQTSYTDGQLLIGNTTGNTLTKATLTQGTGITITNGSGAITIASTATGTVTGVTASSPLASSGGTAPNITITSSTGSGAVVLASSPSLTTPALGTPSSGTLSSCTVDGTNAVGFRTIPVNSQSAAYTAVLADSGKVIFHPSTDANARTFTIPANGSVAYPVGTALSFINMTSQVVTIAITTDTMYLSSAGTTGSRSLAQYGSATAVKMTSTTWLISGSGLT
jgi:hypothetical protein